MKPTKDPSERERERKWRLQKNKGGRPRLGVDVSMVRLSVCETDRDAINIVREALADERGKPITLSEAIRTAVRTEAERWAARGYSGRRRRAPKKKTRDTCGFPGRYDTETSG